MEKKYKYESYYMKIYDYIENNKTDIPFLDCVMVNIYSMAEGTGLEPWGIVSPTYNEMIQRGLLKQTCYGRFENVRSYVMINRGGK